jgi:hypothetical protein
VRGKLSANPALIKAIGLKAAYFFNAAKGPLAELLATTGNLEKTAARPAV